MREIKVRGYAVDEMIGSQWIIGTGVHTIVFTDKYFEETGKKYEHFVFGEYGWVEVHGESIGQYTGLMDKNGTEIYEGDVFINKWKVGHTSLHRVYFCEKELAFMSLTNLNGDLIKESLAGYAEGHNIRVTGNIYENPELLEVTE